MSSGNDYPPIQDRHIVLIKIRSLDYYDLLLYFTEWRRSLQEVDS